MEVGNPVNSLGPKEVDAHRPTRNEIYIEAQDSGARSQAQQVLEALAQPKELGLGLGVTLDQRDEDPLRVGQWIAPMVDLREQTGAEEHRARTASTSSGKYVRWVPNDQITDRLVEVLLLLMGSTPSLVSIKTTGKQSPLTLDLPATGVEYGARGGRDSQPKDVELGTGGEITGEGTDPRLANHAFQQLTNHLGCRGIGAASVTPSVGNGLGTKGVDNPTDTVQLQQRSPPPEAVTETALLSGWSASMERVPFVRPPDFRLLRFEFIPERQQALKGRAPLLRIKATVKKRSLPPARS